MLTLHSLAGKNVKRLGYFHHQRSHSPLPIHPEEHYKEKSPRWSLESCHGWSMGMGMGMSRVEANLTRNNQHSRFQVKDGPRVAVGETSSWWIVSTHLWKICSSNWRTSPQGSGWKPKTKKKEKPPPPRHYCENSVQFWALGNRSEKRS